MDTANNNSILPGLDICIKKGQNYLLGKQYGDGYWVGLLEADVSVVSGFIPLMRILGVKNSDREAKALNYFYDRQNSDGSWSMYYKGEGSLDVTVQTYFCMKMTGVSPESPAMQSAGKFILSNGGVEKTNTYTKIILALFGQYPWSALPSIPPEIINLPKWFYINIYDFASWTRATILAFSIILTAKPVFKLKPEQYLHEIYCNKNNFKTGVLYRPKHPAGPENIFIILNAAIKAYETLPGYLKMGRKAALEKVKEWIVSHQEADGSWGGIMLPWLFSLIALKCAGFTVDHPVIKKGLEGLEDFIDEDEKNLILQPATSPVWDTAWSILALVKSGISPCSERIQKGAAWLLSRQVKTEGDWKVKNPKTLPGCWSFEFENRFYPDIDDTAIVCSALNPVRLDRDTEDEKLLAISKGIKWILEMQNRNGSWAAFDRDNCKRLLQYIPYADFITPLDFGSPDITAHVLCTLGELSEAGINEPVTTGADASSGSSASGRLYLDLNLFGNKVKKAAAYLINSQQNDGSWYGRWGVNYIYGTSRVLQVYPYLKTVLKDNRFADSVSKGKNWLESTVNSDGGWGESCRSYETGSYQALGASTPSQTAWAVLGILSVDPESEIAAGGVRFLMKTQTPEGCWDEPFYTGGGFPGVFYLKYGLYKDYFPLLALSKYMEIKRI
jgi:squalene-hopene/tetraprenyl-beta-curcumene cyclase